MITPVQKASLIAEAGYPSDMLKTCRAIVSYLKRDSQCATDEHALNIAHLIFVAHPGFKLYDHHALEVIADHFTPEYVNDILYINRVMSSDLFDEKLMQQIGCEIERENVLSFSGKRVLLACLAEEFKGLKNANPYESPSAPVTHVASRMVLADSFETAAPDLKQTVNTLAVDVYARYVPMWAKKLSAKQLFFNLAASCLIHQFEPDTKNIEPTAHTVGKSCGRVDMEAFVKKPDMDNTFPWIDESETYLPHRLDQILQASMLAGQAVEPVQAGFLLRALVTWANRRNLVEHKVCDALVGQLIDYICDMARPEEFQSIFYPRGEMDQSEYVYYSKSISDNMQNKVLDRLCIEDQAIRKVSGLPPASPNRAKDNRERG